MKRKCEKQKIKQEIHEKEAKQKATIEIPYTDRVFGIKWVITDRNIFFFFFFYLY